jgi:hypothetical protein
MGMIVDLMLCNRRTGGTWGWNSDVVFYFQIHFSVGLATLFVILLFMHT